MKVTVCELPDEAERRDGAWADLVRYLRSDPTDVLVLPEMPFCEWEIFRQQRVDPAAWQSIVAAHDAMIAKFTDLGAQVVLSSRPVQAGPRRLNQGFSWTHWAGYTRGRAKYYMPDEPDGWEATWFDRGDAEFNTQAVGKFKVGFQICTELLFTQAAWELGARGAQLIAAPRATGGHRRWAMAACLAAIMAGCYVASTNRRSYTSDAFAGRSWLISPEGEILLETSAAEPFLTAEIDVAAVARARATYPRNLKIPSSAYQG